MCQLRAQRIQSIITVVWQQQHITFNSKEKTTTKSSSNQNLFGFAFDAKCNFLFQIINC